MQIPPPRHGATLRKSTFSYSAFLQNLTAPDRNALDFETVCLLEWLSAATMPPAEGTARDVVQAPPSVPHNAMEWSQQYVSRDQTVFPAFRPQLVRLGGVALLLGSWMPSANAQDVAVNMKVLPETASLTPDEKYLSYSAVDTVSGELTHYDVDFPAAKWTAYTPNGEVLSGSLPAELVNSSEARKNWLLCLRGWAGALGCAGGGAFAAEVVARICNKLQISAIRAAQTTCPSGSYYNFTSFGFCGLNMTGGCVLDSRIPK